ncbi:MAG: DUF5818 domain-containing protein [Acidobacteriota bacterium]|nr:DUF5818 domain-containing protein [Acidobacteriota bacterium]
MKTYYIVALTAITTGVFCTCLAAQSAQPSQPIDPTAQSLASPAPDSSAAAVHQATSESRSATATSSSSTKSKSRPFMGTVVRRSEGFVLRAGDLEYKLDNQSEAERYQGKSVKVMGSLDKKDNTIHVQSLEPSPAL